MKKKSLNVGVFNPNLIHYASPYCGDNIFAKGLEANNYNVTRFDYRATTTPDGDIIKKADEVQPDLFWFGKCETIRPDTLRALRSRYPEAIFVKWAADVRTSPTTHDISHNLHVDWFFGTFGGDYLMSHLMPQMKGVASIITFTDSDCYKQMRVKKEFYSDILWTGRTGVGDNSMRNKTISFLNRISNVKVRIAGLTEMDWLGDPEYLYYINGTKIGVGVNSFDRTKYSSDRLGNYVSCGTFYLPQYFEGIEEIFTRGKNLDWFETIEELQQKLEYYLSNETEREKIANNARKFVLKHFDYKPLVENLLNIIKTKKSKYEWDDVYTN